MTEKQDSHFAPRERCNHGVWLGDHCYSCASESDKLLFSEMGTIPVNPACRATCKSPEGLSCDCEYGHPLLCAKAAVSAASATGAQRHWNEHAVNYTLQCLERWAGKMGRAGFTDEVSRCEYVRNIIKADFSEESLPVEAEAIRDAALEEAAKECDALNKPGRYWPERLGKNIRSLKRSRMKREQP